MWGSVTYLNNILPLSLFLTMLSSLKIDEVYCPFSYLTDFTVQSILKFPSEIRALFFKLVWHMKILDGKLSNWRPVAWIQSLWKLLYLGSRNSTSLSFFCIALAICDCTPKSTGNFHKLIINCEYHGDLLTCSLAKFFLE